MKFYSLIFFRKYLGKARVSLKSEKKKTGTLHEDQYTFLIISRSVLLRKRNVSDKSFRENQNTHVMLNHLTPNDPYMGRTAPLTSKRCILYIYSTNIVTEYFKHALFFLFKMQFVS